MLIPDIFFWISQLFMRTEIGLMTCAGSCDYPVLVYFKTSSEVSSQLQYDWYDGSTA
jgi:hypothetical protein